MTNQQMIDAINSSIQDNTKLMTLLRFAIGNAIIPMDTVHLTAICTALGIATS